MSYQPRSSNHNKSDDHRSRRLYNPYQDLGVPVQTLYKLPTSPEYLFQEESVAQHCSWGENLTYYTGIGYLGGAVIGARQGLVEGVKASEVGDSMKLRVNRILNASGHAGRNHRKKIEMQKMTGNSFVLLFGTFYGLFLKNLGSFCATFFIPFSHLLLLAEHLWNDLA